ncbi:MAG: hypothetical protein GXC94_07490 [Comamonadaceae bacterium]|nr:hypothetical protein [Comamonadaceae bacterium]
MNFSLGTLVSLAGFVVLLIVALLLLRAVLTAFQPEPGEVERSWKFRTVVYVALSLAVPLWPLTFPLFLLLAHRSYLAGAPRVGVVA